MALKFDNLLQENWKTMNRDPVDVVSVIKEYLVDHPKLEVHVGTDAQAKGRNKANFVTVVCVHGDGVPGRVFYLKFSKVDIYSLQDKLMNETMLSITVAEEIVHELPYARDNIIIHVDANTKEECASSKHVQALVGMVMGYNFRYLAKPNAWAASHAADHAVKDKNKTRKGHRRK